VPIQVMLVDDSSIVRELIKRALTADTGIEIVATAFNGAVAIPLAKKHQPDIIILDVEMPEMDGITALPKLLEAAPNAKVIMASTLTMRNAGISLQALELGASDCIAKPTARGPEELEIFYGELRKTISALAGSKKPQASSFVAASPSAAAIVKVASKPVKLLSPDAPVTVPVKALAIASSTGGPQALMTVFGGFKDQFKHIPIFVTQHMPPTFTTILAEHISKAGNRSVHEGKEGEIVQPGQTYVAPGNFHMVVEKRADAVIIHTNQDAPENFCRPAADPMLRSLSAVYGTGLLAVVLTGMGSDGLEGAKIVVQKGGHVIAQNEATCVVWGMPRAVTEQGICRAVLPLTEIAPYLIRMISHAHK